MEKKVFYNIIFIILKLYSCLWQIFLLYRDFLDTNVIILARVQRTGREFAFIIFVI